MTKTYFFTIHRFGKMHDGRRVSSVAVNEKDAEENIKAMYPGYTIISL